MLVLGKVREESTCAFSDHLSLFYMSVPGCKHVTSRPGSGQNARRAGGENGEVRGITVKGDAFEA